MFANCLKIGCDANEKMLIGANFLRIIIAAAYIAVFVKKTKSTFLDGASNYDFLSNVLIFILRQKAPVLRFTILNNFLLQFFKTGKKENFRKSLKMLGYSFLRLVIDGMGLDCLDKGLIPDKSAISELINGATVHMVD